eukprot:scaffold4176_cov90-Cylindrotheca_fusiformis.AAC.1
MSRKCNALLSLFWKLPLLPLGHFVDAIRVGLKNLGLGFLRKGDALPRVTRVRPPSQASLRMKQASRRRFKDLCQEMVKDAASAACQE